MKFTKITMTSSGLLKVLKVCGKLLLLHSEVAKKEDKVTEHRINPYNPGNPVKPVHFAGRIVEITEIREKLAAAKEGYPVSLFVKGEWGIGKTSLLRKLHPEFSEHGTVIREDIPEGSASAQIRALYPAIIQDLRAEVGDDSELDFDLNYDQPRTLRKILTKLISTLWKEKALLAIIVLDNLERAKPEFLAGVKDIFQRVGEDAPHFMLVFAGKSLPGSGEHASDPIARFFQTIPIGPMNAEEALDAISKPVELDPEFKIEKEAAELIQSRAAGHPYFLKQICSQVFQSAGGIGKIDREWLEDRWGEIETSLENTRFRSEFDDLPKAEANTLLYGSLQGPEFSRSAIFGIKGSTVDTALRRLTKERGLLRLASRGIYEFYHPLFHAYVLTKANAQGIVTPSKPDGSLKDLITQDESNVLEFKETLQFNLRTEQKDTRMSDVVLKTIAAFHNWEGGTLLIGVADGGMVKGLGPDMSLRPLKKRNDDHFILTLQDLVHDNLTPRRPNRVKIRVEKLAGEKVCVVDAPALEPLTYLGGKLYVREGPRSIELSGEEMELFLKERNRE